MLVYFPMRLTFDSERAFETYCFDRDKRDNRLSLTAIALALGIRVNTLQVYAWRNGWRAKRALRLVNEASPRN